MNRLCIAEQIKKYRREYHLTQAEFADKLGVSAQAVSKWERLVCYPDITLLPDIARILNCSILDFFEE